MAKSIEIIAYNIRRLRQENDLTQRKFGDVVGVEQQTIHMWETAKRDVDSKYFDIFCEKFNVPLSYFTYDPEHDDGLEGLPSNLALPLRSATKLSPAAKKQIASFIRFVTQEERARGGNGSST